MRYLSFLLFMGVMFASFSFISRPPDKNEITVNVDAHAFPGDSVLIRDSAVVAGVNAVQVGDLIDYAKSFVGKPYVWGSVNPKIGFDCSGFVNHVATHFGFTVPRTSAQYTNLGTEINKDDAHPGDIILFTGTNLKRRVVGHMGIITDNNSGDLEFIHSSSGKGNVNVMNMTPYYEARFVKIIRLFSLS